MANYTSQDLQDNLDYLEITKQKIKEAIVSKGVEVSDDVPFRNYADKILSIEQDAQDLALIIDEQDALIKEQSTIITQLEDIITTKSSDVNCYLYVFCRTEEPTIYNGIWMKYHISFEKFIVSDLTTSEILKTTFEPNSVVLKTGNMYKAQLLGPVPNKVIGDLRQPFDMAYVTDENGKVIQDIETYYTDGEKWIQIL